MNFEIMRWIERDRSDEIEIVDCELNRLMYVLSKFEIQVSDRRGGGEWRCGAVVGDE